MGTARPFTEGACTVSSQTPPGRGASSWTTSLGHDGDVTVHVQFASAVDTSRASAAGARNGEPSIRAINASLMSLTDVTVGGAAGSSIRSTLSRAMASTTAVITADVVAGPLPPSIAATVPGIANASAEIAGLSVSAGRHRTSAFTSRL